jgi:hypothetical protein
VQAGSSNGAFFKTSTPALFDRTKLGVNEYRMEVYTPPYMFSSNRPRFLTQPPTFAPYGSSFTVDYLLPQGGDITGVVLQDLGGVTHNYGIGHRAQLLSYTARKANATCGTLTIQAPANSNIAPPAHYVLFLLSGTTYSRGAWVQVKPAVPSVPTTIPNSAVYVPELSSTFEGTTGYKVSTWGGAKGQSNLRSGAARGSGRAGFRANITVSGSSIGTVSLRSRPVALRAWKPCYMHVWMRSSSARSVEVALVEANGSTFTPVVRNPIRVTRGWSLRVVPEMKPRKDGNFAVHINMGNSGPGTVDVDDIEVYCER